MKTRLALFAVLLATPTFALSMRSVASAEHPPISLKGYDNEGNIVTITQDQNSTVPYSPKATCGTCHNYSEISLSYHVDQGRSVISDSFGQANGRPEFVLSNGMFGGW
jgi:hypothetical protein